jgi:dinuclear metal center YbgI/SA1388 family protein
VYSKVSFWFRSANAGDPTVNTAEDFVKQTRARFSCQKQAHRIFSGQHKRLGKRPLSIRKAFVQDALMPSAADVVDFLNDFLRIGQIEDWPNALNGLQIENSGRLTKIGAAVDVSTQTLNAAAERGIDFMVVHHGLFWPGLQAITKGFRRQLKLAFDHDIALYSAHLPLDVHPRVGNNARLAEDLGFEITEPFLETKGQLIGVKARSKISRDELTRKLEASLGSAVKTFATGPDEVRVIGIVTGGGGSEIHEAAREGIDTFITGEAPHWAAIAAAEIGINLLLGGHYATETLGVKALATYLSERFQLPWEFIDYPTAL